MRSDLDASKVVCRVCGDIQVLDTEGRRATVDLAAFTRQHSAHDRFRIDVVTGPVPEPRVLPVPYQRDSGSTDNARTA